MSCWTHITASIDVDTHMTDHAILYRVTKLMKDAPKITGSERDAEVFINVLQGYNVSIGSDCNVCEYRHTRRDLGDHEFVCNAKDAYECPTGRYQTRVVLTIIGDLRDREVPTTRKEYAAFLRYLRKECNFTIGNKATSII